MVILQNLLYFLSILYWCNFTISGTLSPHEHLTRALLAPHGRNDFKTRTELRESQARTELEHGKAAYWYRVSYDDGDRRWHCEGA